MCGEPGWQPVWADEFDGSALDNGSWTTDIWDTLSALREAKNSPENVYLQ